MTEQPKYHCKDCERKGITNHLLSMTLHQERRRSRRALAIYAAIVLTAFAVVYGCAVAGLEVVS